MTLNEKIKELLRRDPKLRSSDKELFIEIFRLKGLNLIRWLVLYTNCKFREEDYEFYNRYKHYYK